MTELCEIFAVDPKTWLDTMKPYQRNIANVIYTETKDYEEVAKRWLTADSLPNNVPFGTKKTSSIFYEKVLDEIEAFFSGDEKYENCRIEILKESGIVQSYIVGVLSIALAPILEKAAPFLAPVISIVLFTIGKIGLNAWLTMRKEQREKNNQ